MAERYQSVNGSWPETVPVPTPQEAASAARRLYRLGMGKSFKGKVKVVTGNRHTWIRSGTLFVNPNGKHFGGWKDIVHGISHYVHHRKFPNHKPHDGRGTHAFIERAMIEHIVNSGWLEGKLRRPEKEAPSFRAIRKQRVDDKITAWERKLRRAETALRKLRKQKAYYQRIGVID